VTLTAAIRTRLLAQSALTALVGTRVYALVIPQQPTLPAIRLQQIGRDEPMHLRGPVTVFRARLQVDAIAYSKETADAVDAAIDGDGLGPDATGLKGWTGEIGSPPFAVKAILPADVREMYHPEELKQYRISRDYFVWFSP
jgi:hypothetical protein